MPAYYNEIDPAAAHILRAMIDADVIAPGDVDTRSIKEVQPDELSAYTQCHFFAGGGLWSVAARLAGWPDDCPLWTGSCPCQPFSAAGKGLGTDDPRHLWPDFHRLIRACRPPIIMGEQVAGAPGYGWFDGVRADLEGEGYASRAVDFPACSVDAPHQRNRLYWIAMAEPDSRRHEGRSVFGPGESRGAHEQWAYGQSRGSGGSERRPLDHSIRPRLEGHVGHGDGSGRTEQDRSVTAPDGASTAGDVANGTSSGRDAGTHPGICGEAQGERPWHGELERPYGAHRDSLYADADSHRCDRQGLSEGSGRERVSDSARHPQRNGTYWSGAEWLICHDGKARRAEPGIRFLVDGLPGRVDLWRVGGNAIVPEAAAEVIAAFMDVYGVPAMQEAA